MIGIAAAIGAQIIGVSLNKSGGQRSVQQPQVQSPRSFNQVYMKSLVEQQVDDLEYQVLQDLQKYQQVLSMVQQVNIML